MPQIVNPDGTVQVAPPTRSAFAPQPTQAPPAPQAAPVAAPSGIDPAGAIHALIAAVAGALAPKSVSQRGSKLKQQMDQAESGAPQTSELGQQF